MANLKFCGRITWLKLSPSSRPRLLPASPRTIRDWAARFDIGRRIQGRWAISKVALGLFLDGDAITLAAYLAGDRSSPKITEYFEHCDVPLPRRRTQNQLTPMVGIREEALSEVMGFSRS
jgi:hypothetical protein